MQTRIHARLLDRPGISEANDILRSCVHCGFCTAVCPTYQLSGDELDGPRGRIYLIKDMLETDELDPAAGEHLDRCLTCRACETACPSGVRYGDLLDIARGMKAEKRRPSPRTSFYSTILRAVIPQVRILPWLLRFAAPFRMFFGGLVPARYPARQYPARVVTGTRRVIVLDGCVQRAATPNVNAALEYLLGEQGVGVERVSTAGCCGALDYHLGEHEAGKARMRRLLDALLPQIDDVEAIISSASGCGVTIKEYPGIFATDPVYRDIAERVCAKVVDVSEYLAGFSWQCRPKLIAFHAPCTLQHGQRLQGVVESLLESAGFDLVDVADSHLCCGSAGTYSILQPDWSNELKHRKVDALTRHTPEVIATANVGCQLHLGSGTEVPVVHWLELMADNSSFSEQPPQ